MVVGQTEQAALPPCNTGAQTACGEEAKQANSKHDLTKQGVEVLIDFVGITYQEDVTMVLDLYGAEGWTPIPHGWRYYKRGYQRGFVKVWYDGKPEQGVNVQISGQGCRELEARGIVKDWVSWLSVHVFLGRLSRLDVAMDDRALKSADGLLKKENIEAALRAKTVVSQYREVTPIEKRSLQDDSLLGWSRNFGSGKSETAIHIYDKVLEQGITESYHWMRCELRTRREKAHELARAIVEFGLSGVAGAIYRLLDFKEQGTHSQRERWDTCAWWSAFIGAVEKLRLTVRPAIKTIDDVKGWFMATLAPLVAVVYDYERMTGEKGHKGMFLRELIKEGRLRRQPRHERYLSRVEFLLPVPA